MKISKLSLKKVNNIDRQIDIYRNEIAEIINEKNNAKHLVYKSGDRSGTLRDFYEFYIDDQSLINIVGDKYWDIDPSVYSEFFNTHIGCLGGFGNYWDEVYVRILLQKELSESQKDALYEMFKLNYTSHSNSISKTEIRKMIIDYTVNEFLMYRCQDCGDSGCGGFTLIIEQKDDKIIWTDNKKLMFQFKADEYEAVLLNYLP